MEKICQLSWGPPATLDAAETWGAAPGEQAAAFAVAPPTRKKKISDADVMRRMIKATGGLPNVPAEFAGSAVAEAEFLLQVASEVEHGLLVLYLYAAYSTNDTQTTPPSTPAPFDAEGWQTRLLNIAIQEMDHLLNVQNMLLAVGKKPYFGRGNFPPLPDRAKFYPFPFQFEPLSQISLGKYVSAESPDPVLGMIDQSKLTEDQKTWLPRAVASGKAGAMQSINHVGVIYAKLYWMLQDDGTPVLPWLLPKEQFEKVRHVTDIDLPNLSTSILLQGKFDEGFQGDEGPEPPDAESEHRVIWTLDSRAKMRAAIAQIAEQGEGTKIASDSHFVSFLQLFGEFVTKVDAGSPIPVLPVPTHPNTANDPATEGGRITHPVTLLWARLFNARYRILIAELALIMSESVKENLADGAATGLASRPRLIGDAISREMRQPFGIRGLAKRLTAMPLKADGSGNAGAPFEMPAAPLPTEPTAIRDLLLTFFDESKLIVDDLLALTGSDALPQHDRDGLTNALIAKDKPMRSDVALMKLSP
ncbi:ferritin-like domain-containing protein [Planctomicrobium piriforme]|uniref:Ferritin-like n=1 Tax=Planctomicrobium piriforme TaxID=1576369 RepID=A0A1I3GI71_9PLAN|nr:ferritin-like domain-containing protein [Planctomicrobium piriforme]SFI23166.1 Ferritin-like [Planctomicrobium piriforme]